MTKRFREAFRDALKSSGRSIAEIARVSGVSKEQLKKLNQRDTATTNVDDAIRIAHAFGQSLDEFLDDQTPAHRSELLDLYTQLSESERQFLLDVARARTASDREVG